MVFREYLDNLKGKRVAVVGAGVSNTPLIDALLDAGVAVTVRDKGTTEELGGAAQGFEGRGARLALGDGYLDGVDEDVIFRTPGLMPSHPELAEAVRRGAALTSEMEAFFDVCPCEIVAVTGSDGKTTTTTIIAEILRREGRTVHIGGNIGTPLLCSADSISPNDIAVLELSSFQLITMGKSPQVAVVTNVAPNHLDMHKDMAEYVDAKRNIVAWQKTTDKAVLNRDNDISRGFIDSVVGKALFFSRNGGVRDGVYLENGTLYAAERGLGEKIIDARDILLPGVHNVENYMAAFAAVRGLAGLDAMREVARSFKGVRHRIELVRELRGVRYYTDSIATSPTRAIAGLRAFDRKVILIAGGKDKGIAFDGFGAEIASSVKTLVLTGLTAEKIRSAVEGAPGYSRGTPNILMCGDFEEAVLAAAAAAKKGDVVLLSPGCTSFDRFTNFEERGDAFRRIVEGLE
jgi:UDP-N-acetylmuramoylalanine--D-glutamate ligase